MAFQKKMAMAAIPKAGSILIGLMRSPEERVISTQRLLAYCLSRLPTDRVVQHLEYAPELPASLLDGGSLYPNRAAMLHALPKGGRVAEVGTYQGKFAERIAQVCGPEELHVFDIDFRPFREEAVRTALQGRALEKHHGDSSEELQRLPDHFFDWIYIDGDHGYESVRRDLHVARLKVKRGGHLMCNDYTNWSPRQAQPYGVARAVNEFCLEQQATVRGLALQPGGYYDILLKMPY